MQEAVVVSAQLVGKFVAAGKMMGIRLVMQMFCLEELFCHFVTMGEWNSLIPPPGDIVKGKNTQALTGSRLIQQGWSEDRFYNGGLSFGPAVQ